MSRVTRRLSLVAVVCLALALPLGGVAAAGQGNGGSGGSGNKPEVLATLKVESDTVQVKKAGKDDFEDASDGQKLREGDTVKTDATGRAEVDYSDDSYTRLDVNTTFKIIKLTEEEGARQVEGGLESGRTWNRTEAVTESGSFEQSGGGATAAVTGTAFAVECTSLTECTFIQVVHESDLTGDGETKHLVPLSECDSDDGALCDAVKHLTPDEIAANKWIQENLLRDLLERGYGPGPFVVGGTLVIQDGEVISFVETTTSTSTSTTSSTTTTTQPKPTADDPPLDCEVDLGEGGTEVCDYAGTSGEDFEPTSEIIVYEGDLVFFKARVLSNGASEPIFIVFDEIDDVGQFCRSADLVDDYGWTCDVELETGVRYAVGTEFAYLADYCYYGDCPEGTVVFHLENDAAGAGPQVSVPVQVVDYCSYGSFSVAGTGNEPTSGDMSPATSATPEPDVTTSTSPPATTDTTPTTLAGDPDVPPPAND